MNVGDGGPVECFLLVPTNRAVRGLRRYLGPPEGVCTANRIGYHNASIDCKAVYVNPSLDQTVHAPAQHRGRGDPPWPERCLCGYQFRVGDPRQVWLQRLYARADLPEYECTLAAAPVGAMWDAVWMLSGWRGTDGHSWTVRLPNRTDWTIDGPGTSGGRWSRTGEAPLLVVTPSIAAGDAGMDGYYHGYLGSNGQPPGVLSPHIG